ncbi:hypothetical protein GCM10010990_37900 [Croceicoccus mobilis]|uniref:Uncharacterized protein n=1 Tax=Croceicoccus mobilis TaxID=1703339 RepID=A0A916ZBS7_9SPHN|nr:hypothetical protein GCM10010990_37900 [Croceicoccus mobilis]
MDIIDWKVVSSGKDARRVFIVGPEQEAHRLLVPNVDSLILHQLGLHDQVDLVERTTEVATLKPGKGRNRILCQIRE